MFLYINGFGPDCKGISTFSIWKDVNKLKSGNAEIVFPQLKGLVSNLLKILSGALQRKLQGKWESLVPLESKERKYTRVKALTVKTKAKLEIFY